MKKVFSLILIICYLLLLTACGNSKADTVTDENKNYSTTEEISEQKQDDIETKADSYEQSDNENTKNDDKSDVLVVVFSVTGNTKGIAEKIASSEDADMYEIIPAEPYTDKDIDYNDSNSRATKEQNDDTARPAIGSETIDISGYSRIYVGYPIWFGREPRIMDTFAEGYDFGNATMIPFCTSGSSGIGNSGTNMAELAGSGNWIEGKRFGADASEEEIEEWIKSLAGAKLEEGE